MDKPGVIYVFKEEFRDRYKVGFTSKDDPTKSRQPGIQTGSSDKIHLIHMWQGTHDEELALHRALSPYRTGGGSEWYEFTVGTLLEAISHTGEHLRRPKPAEESLFDYMEPGHVELIEGPYKGLEGFYSVHELIPLQDFAPEYRSTALDWEDEEDLYLGCHIYLLTLSLSLYVSPGSLRRAD